MKINTNRLLGIGFATSTIALALLGFRFRSELTMDLVTELSRNLPADKIACRMIGDITLPVEEGRDIVLSDEIIVHGQRYIRITSEGGIIRLYPAIYFGESTTYRLGDESRGFDLRDTYTGEITHLGPGTELTVPRQTCVQLEAGDIEIATDAADIRIGDGEDNTPSVEITCRHGGTERE